MQEARQHRWRLDLALQTPGTCLGWSNSYHHSQPAHCDLLGTAIRLRKPSISIKKTMHNVISLCSLNMSGKLKQWYQKLYCGESTECTIQNSIISEVVVGGDLSRWVTVGIVETFGTSFEFGALPNKSEDFGPSEPCKGALQDAAGSSFNAELQHLPPSTANPSQGAVWSADYRQNASENIWGC